MLNILYYLFVFPFKFIVKKYLYFRVLFKYSMIGRKLWKIPREIWWLLIKAAIIAWILTWIYTTIEKELSKEKVEIYLKNQWEKEFEQYCTLIDFKDTLQKIALKNLYNHIIICGNENVIMFENDIKNKKEFIAIKQPTLLSPRVRTDAKTGEKLYYSILCFQAYSKYEKRNSIFLKGDIYANCPSFETLKYKEVRFPSHPYYAYVFSIENEQFKLLSTPFKVLDIENKTEFFIFQPLGDNYTVKPIESCDILEKRLPN